mmetsp:Transcript_2396/g.6442  ORF Transcript_2396/g.6442 Transcript_2396/m.6442 type:complete len:94 (+) Transcript_2396:720-1001(+)
MGVIRPKIYLAELLELGKLTTDRAGQNVENNIPLQEWRRSIEINQTELLCYLDAVLLAEFATEIWHGNARAYSNNDKILSEGTIVLGASAAQA